MQPRHLAAGAFLARHQPIITGAAVFLVLVAAWFYWELPRHE